MTKRSVVLLSGGLDSSVLLAHLLRSGDEVRALAVDYGQRHRRELSSAISVAGRCHVPIDVIDLSALRAALPGSSQTDRDIPVPHGHYEAESMKATVVPNRNMILLAVAGGACAARGFDRIAIAAHAGDHAIYPDCRPEFIEAMRGALALCHYKPVEIFAPFVSMTKAEIVSLGAKLGVPLELTWSCYERDFVHCGKCGTCFERREAFERASVADPTKYAGGVLA